MGAQVLGGEEGAEAGDEGREEYFVHHRPHHQDLDPEDRPGDGSSENGGESGADPADNQLFAIPFGEAEQVGDGRSGPGTDLRPGSLFSRRTACDQGDDCGQKLDGYDRHIDLAVAFVDRFDHLFGPVSLGFGGESSGKPDAEGQPYGEQIVVVERQKPPGTLSVSEDVQEEGDDRPDHDAHCTGEYGPLGDTQQNRRMLGREFHGRRFSRFSAGFGQL